MPTINVNLTQDELTEAVTLWLRQQGYIASSVLLFRNARDRPGEPDTYGATGIGCASAPPGFCYVCGDDPNGKRQPCAGKRRVNPLKCPREEGRS